ncbi:MAG: hypothetical protein EZS26_003255 [Candidatus Ordinivivax streblomastigis]|uniref:Winged helix-turn helix domain-containing protein n=1 Tax=Candidatus Ordinivivax streblomastigis TaxID=2540710 RepID=A0A5M8NYE2_9BACT|nr:MAG: hypothetical protein EZS26_003255 [Candidatus Ordinivivax streblomastigis]
MNIIFIFAPKNDEALQGLSSSEYRRITIGIKFAKRNPRLDWQIIYCVAINVGKTASELSVLLGVSKSRIYRIIQSYNKDGKDWRVSKQWGGRREARTLMSLEEEGQLLKEVETEALSGRILIHRDIKGKVESKVGRQVSDDYVWDLFKRHHWKKKVPRGSHPKSNEGARQEYKKNSRS